MTKEEKAVVVNNVVTRYAQEDVCGRELPDIDWLVNICTHPDIYTFYATQADKIEIKRLALEKIAKKDNHWYK